MTTNQFLTSVGEIMEINIDIAVVMFLVFIFSTIILLWKPKKRDAPDFKESKKTIKENTPEKRQRNIIKLALVFILVVGLYPPWVKTFKTQYVNSENPIGHHLIFKPPKSEIPPEGFKIDVVRVLLYWGMVVVVAGGLVLISRKPEE
jgi:hypothetical protein